MKPYVILNAAMTLDGKIATKTGSSEISGKEDLERVHEIRKEVDGIMVGIGTVLADDPRLTVHDEDAVLRAKELSKRVNVFYSSKESVDLAEFMEHLYSKGIETLMLEGGSTLNFSMIRENLIDEVRICIAPMIVGGKDSKTFFDGEGFDYMKEAIPLKLEKYYPLGKDFVMEYKVLK